MLGAGYERLHAKSDVGDPSGSITYDFPANAFRAFGEYSLPLIGPLTPHLGAAVGLVSASGSVRVTQTGVSSASIPVTGSGALFEMLVGGVWSGASRVSSVGSVGYRYARVGEVKTRDQVIRNADGSKYTLDYSGFLVRIGVRVALAP